MRYSYLYISLIFLSCALFAQEAKEGEMTLEKAIAIGLENNFRIKIDEKSIELAERNDSWARAGRAPSVDLRGYFNNFIAKDNNQASFLQGTYYNGSLGAAVDANWVVFAGGRVRIAKEQLGLATEQQRLNQKVGIHDLIRNVYQRYYDVLLQQERMLVLLENFELSKTELLYEQTRKEFGVSNAYNLLQFENSVLTDSTNIVNQKVIIDVSKRNLYNVLDIAEIRNYEFPEVLSTELEEVDAEKLKGILSEENYTLKSLGMIAELDVLNTRLEEASRKPTVGVNGSIGFAENGFKFFADNPNTGDPYKLLFSNQITGSLNASVSWNLYDGGVKRGNIENAKLQQEISQMNILEAKVELNNQLDILIANFENQKSQIKMIDDQLQISKRNIEMTEERFKAGVLSSLDFRNVQNQYLAIAFSKVNAIYNLILTKTEIDYLVGKFGDDE